jgi:hypothetical protein
MSEKGSVCCFGVTIKVIACSLQSRNRKVAKKHVDRLLPICRRSFCLVVDDGVYTLSWYKRGVNPAVNIANPAGNNHEGINMSSLSGRNFCLVVDDGVYHVLVQTRGEPRR